MVETPEHYSVGRPSYEYIGRLAKGYYDRNTDLSELRSILKYNDEEMKMYEK